MRSWRGGLEFDYIWTASNLRKNEEWKEREKRLERGQDVEFSKARVVLAVMRLWLDDDLLRPFDTTGQSDVEVSAESLEFGRLAAYCWELTPQGREEVERPGYEPYWEEITDD
jgi:hypothetical protein